MYSLRLQYLSSLSLTVEDARTLQRLREYKGRQKLFIQQTPQILESLKTVAIIESNESSNRLEGVIAPKDRIEALGGSVIFGERYFVLIKNLKSVLDRLIPLEVQKQNT